MFDNPLVFALICGCIAVIAIAVILYFLVFKKKIEAGLEKGREKKAAKVAAYEKTTNLASDIFAGRDKEEKFDKKLSDDEIKTITKFDKNVNVAKEVIDKEKKEKEKKEKEKKEKEKAEIVSKLPIHPVLGPSGPK